MTVEQTAEKTGKALVTFEYENGTSFYRVTNANTQIVTHLGVFTSDSSMQIKLPSVGTSFTDNLATIELDAGLNYGFLNPLTNAETHSQVTVYIREYFADKKQETFDLKYRFRGSVRSAEINVGGRLNRTKLVCVGIAGEVQVKMGIVTSIACINPFGNNETCQVDVPSLSVTGTVTAVDKQKITISGIPYNSEDQGYYDQGYVDLKGARSKILRRDGGTDDFFLEEYANPLWVGQTITVAPGCDHSPSVCAGRFNNIANSNFLAIDRLEYNPQFENPSQ